MFGGVERGKQDGRALIGARMLQVDRCYFPNCSSGISVLETPNVDSATVA
jgi:hypothetical protein